MAHKWFRLHNSTRNNRKIAKLSDRQFRGWIMLLTVASEHDGDIPADYEGIAYWLRMKAGEVRNLLHTLAIVGLMENHETFFRPHDWSEHQYKSDCSTERVAAFRKRRGNVSVTSPDSDSDSDSEPEPEKKDSPSEIAKGDFEAVWDACPRKVGKRAAKAAYARALTRASHELILAGMVVYAKTRVGEEERYTAHPETWLNRDGWLDQPGGKVTNALGELSWAAKVAALKQA